MAKNKSILRLGADEAREFFLKQESYCNFDLPPYIEFAPLLNALNEVIEQNNYEFNAKKSKAKKYQKVNYKIFNNKNGQYDWRPFELINPILYVYLVREITSENSWKEIKDFLIIVKKKQKI